MRGLSRWGQAGAGAVVAAALLWTIAHALANREAALARLREKAGEALRARLGEVELGDEASVDWLFRATVGPVTVPAAARGAPPVVRVERVKVRAAWSALVAGRVEAASIRLLGVRVVPGPGGRELRALAARMRAARPRQGRAAGAGRGADPVLFVKGLTVELESGEEVGPFDGRLSRAAEGEWESLSAEARLPGGGRVEGTLRRRLGPAPTWLAAVRVQASPADLPASLAARAIRAQGGALTVDLSAEGAGGDVRASVRGAAANLLLAGEPLGPDPVGPLSIAGELEVAWSSRDGRLLVRRAVLRPAGPLALEASGWVAAGGELPFELKVVMPPVDYRALVDALPPALAPGPAAPRPEGAFGGTLALSGALRRPSDWTVTADVDLAGLREVARRAPPSPLRATFTARLTGADGDDPVSIVVGPENPAFVPLAELPEHVYRAVTTSEDAGFFGHRGFDFDELRNALAAGARAGRLGRGGSTITQQLAKNLFLSRDRTLARKVREALVTVALEGTVPKARLLEIYLNVIEWGPGLHGIGPAARRYFDKDARELTPREACFLAAAVPSPIRTYGAVASGRPASLWSQRIDDLLLKLELGGVLSGEQLQAALDAPLRFGALSPGGGASAGGPDAGAGEPP
ncbi:MAG TPA: biosynthetic peptidoglycan transglycosylase, partial [Anaeromyxobacteraceae bacterium]|nr:biosynthetic peptidoglycan transglycosylase [Anaeromyxobacteraceae bacterium]